MSAMGLMGYNEVRRNASHARGYPPYETAPRHPVTIDSLLAMMAAAGPKACQGNCRRNMEHGHSWSFDNHDHHSEKAVKNR